MRRLLDLIALGVVIVLLLVAVLHLNHQRRRDEAVSAARLAVERIQAEINLLQAIGKAADRHDASRGVDPTWFDGELPLNPLLVEQSRWMDVATASEAMRRHPRVWQVEEGGDQAMFWYNPMQGVVRARVPAQRSKELTRELYAEVNNLGAELE